MTDNKIFIEKQKKSLEIEKKKLQKKIDELDKFPEYGQSDEDNAREVTDYESNLSMEKQLKFLLKKVDTALKAIKKGTYGQCRLCKNTIENGRLELMPYADICVNCSNVKKR